MRSERKEPTSDLRKYYTVFLELGLIAVLLIFIVAMKMEWTSEKQKVDLIEEQEVVEMKEVIKTQQKKTPPPPPKPQVPVEVPDDEIIEDQEINLDADLDLSEKLDMPPPPKNDEPEEEFFVAVEQMPKLIGGLAELQKKIDYPRRAARAGIEGRVIIQFIVTKEGNVKDPKVIRGIGGGCDKEALRVVKQAKFKPGRQRGKAVPVQYSLPIRFRLQ